MKRFITYVFEYDNGVKGRNIGFIKTDIRGSDCRMEIHIRNLNRYQGKGTVYLLMDDKELTGVAIGEMALSQGRGDWRQMLRIHPVMETGYDFSRILGVGIRCGNQYYAASCWKDTIDGNFQRGRFHIWSKREAGELEEETETASLPKPEGKGESKQPKPETGAESDPPKPEDGGESKQPEAGTESGQPKPEAVSGQSEPEAISGQSEPETGNIPEQSKTSERDVPEQKLVAEELQLAQSVIPSVTELEKAGHEEETEMQPQASLQAEGAVSPARVEIQRIDLNGIRQLPKKNWYLCSNSFLLHGFFNYHYLILKKAEWKNQTKYYLGVPGIFEKPERVMALLFGFPEFEKEESGKKEAIPKMPVFGAEPETGDPPEGSFGYWFCLLDM